MMEFVQENLFGWLWCDIVIKCLYCQVSMDKLFGCMWHVVAGEEFSFDLTYEVRRQLFLDNEVVPREIR